MGVGAEATVFGSVTCGLGVGAEPTVFGSVICEGVGAEVSVFGGVICGLGVGAEDSIFGGVICELGVGAEATVFVVSSGFWAGADAGATEVGCVGCVFAEFCGDEEQPKALKLKTIATAIGR